MVNTYKLSYHSSVPKAEKYTNQDAFRTALIAECFTIASRCKRKRYVIIAKLPNTIAEEPHILMRRAFKQDCVVCKKEGISRQEKKRRIFVELRAQGAYSLELAALALFG